MNGSYLLCEPTVLNLEHLFNSIFRVYKQLKELGFTYYQGKITIIDMEANSND